MVLPANRRVWRNRPATLPVEMMREFSREPVKMADISIAWTTVVRATETTVAEALQNASDGAAVVVALVGNSGGCS